MIKYQYTYYENINKTGMKKKAIIVGCLGDMSSFALLRQYYAFYQEIIIHMDALIKENVSSNL